jgi:hypothetical protein
MKMTVLAFVGLPSCWDRGLRRRRLSLDLGLLAGLPVSPGAGVQRQHRHRAPDAGRVADPAPNRSPSADANGAARRDDAVHASVPLQRLRSVRVADCVPVVPSSPKGTTGVVVDSSPNAASPSLARR